MSLWFIRDLRLVGVSIRYEGNSSSCYLMFQLTDGWVKYILIQKAFNGSVYRGILRI